MFSRSARRLRPPRLPDSAARIPARRLAARSEWVLLGEGKAMRHVKFASLRDVERPFVHRFLGASVEQAAPAGTRGIGQSVIESSGAGRGAKKRAKSEQ